MRRLLVIVALVFMVMAVLAPAALAVKPEGGCPVGPKATGGPHDGPDINEWEMWGPVVFGGALLAEGHIDAVEDVYPIFAKDDKNGDLLLCVIKQVLPNDASGHDTWFVSKDNTPK